MSAGELLGQPKLSQTTICNELQILFHHAGIHSEYATWHCVACVFDFQRCTLKNHLNGFLLEFLSPQMWILELDLIDHIDAEVEVHRLVSQDVLELLCNPGHLVTATH